MPRSRCVFLLTTLATVAAAPICAGAVEMSANAAWRTMPKYEPGQDMGALLTIDREVIRAMQSPQTRSACAAKLAGVLTQPDTTMAARQYICLQLRPAVRRPKRPGEHWQAFHERKLPQPFSTRSRAARHCESR